MASKNNTLDDISMVITSCGRSDLLARTLLSMDSWLHLIHHKIIVDDFSIAQNEISQLTTEYGFQLIKNKTQLGQHRSIDIAYQQIATTYVFHCEDDWEFFKMPDFQLAKLVLEEAKVSCMCFRKIDDRSRSKYPKRTIDVSRYEPAYIKNKKYLVIRKDWHPSRGAFTFNPNLSKLQLYKNWGPYSQYRSERNISKLMKKCGYIVAYEPLGSCIHIGWNRHISDPTKPVRDKTFIGKTKRSYAKRMRKAKKALEHLSYPLKH